jgi:hypothetical protein
MQATQHASSANTILFQVPSGERFSLQRTSRHTDALAIGAQQISATNALCVAANPLLRRGLRREVAEKSKDALPPHNSHMLMLRGLSHNYGSMIQDRLDAGPMLRRRKLAPPDNASKPS